MLCGNVQSGFRRKIVTADVMTNFEGGKKHSLRQPSLFCLFFWENTCHVSCKCQCVRKGFLKVPKAIWRDIAIPKKRGLLLWMPKCRKLDLSLTRIPRKSFFFFSNSPRNNSKYLRSRNRQNFSLEKNMRQKPRNVSANFSNFKRLRNLHHHGQSQLLKKSTNFPQKNS